MTDLTTPLVELSGTTPNMEIDGIFKLFKRNSTNIVSTKSAQLAIPEGIELTVTGISPTYKSKLQPSMGTFFSVNADMVTTRQVNADMVTTRQVNADTMDVGNLHVANTINMPSGGCMLMGCSTQLHLMMGSTLNIDSGAQLFIDYQDVTAALGNINFISSSVYELLNRVTCIEQAPGNWSQISSMERRLMYMEAKMAKMEEATREI